jgi:hypothetical protein
MPDTISVVVVIVVFAWWLSKPVRAGFRWYEGRLLDRRWEEAARALGLSFGRSLSDAAIYGERGSLAVAVRAGNALNSRTGRVTSYRVGYPALGLGLVITRRTGLRAATAKLATKDIRTGSEDFDRLFIVDGASTAGIRAFLNRRRMSILTQLAEQHRRLEVTDDRIEVVTSGFELDMDVLIATTEGLLIAAAQLMSNVERAPNPTDQFAKGTYPDPTEGAA